LGVSLAALLSLVPLNARAKSTERRVRRGYPSTCRVDAFVDGARSMRPEERLARARKIIAYIIDSQPPESDGRDEIWVWEYFLGRWAVLARETGDATMLTAVDEADTDAGFALSTCLFYTQVTDVPGFAEHYASDAARQRLGTCWHGDDLRKAMVTPPAPTVARAMSRDPVLKACELDRQLSRLRALAPRARQAEIELLIEKALDLDATDLVGGLYLNQRVPSLLLDADEVVLNALDAVARRRMTSKMCRYFGHATSSKQFARHYRDPERRARLAPCEKDEGIRLAFERAFAR
jgi:hypothetical protein